MPPESGSQATVGTQPALAIVARTINGSVYLGNRRSCDGLQYFLEKNPSVVIGLRMATACNGGFGN